MGDWESRNFINITYFSLFPLISFLLLLIIQKKTYLPIWAYIIPLLFLTKPIIIVTIPFLLLALLKTNGRAKKIVSLSFIVVILQIYQLIFSRLNGIFIQDKSDISLILKLKATIVFYFGIIANYITGPSLKSSPIILIILGLLIVSYFVFRILKPRNNRQRYFILTGLLIAFITMGMNCVLISDHWSYSGFKFKHVELYRHTISIFYAVFFLIIALLNKYEGEYFKFGNLKLQKASVYLLLWGLLSGWIPLGINASFEPTNDTVIGNSTWKENSSRISSSQENLIIQLDPKGWVYTIQK